MTGSGPRRDYSAPAEVLALAYPGRPDVDLFTLRGCGGVSNGYISAGSGYY